MSTFAERESKEDTYAWTKFESWLKKGEWKYKRFRYAKDLSEIDIDRLQMPNDQKIFFKRLLKAIDFDHDGIMSRGFPSHNVETWFFDLKYKEKEITRTGLTKTWVNQKDYDSYYKLSIESGVPFIIVAYVHENDSLYFHRVRNSRKEPKPYKFWDNRPAKYGGQKWVYEMPEEEYHLITGFDVPFEIPKSLIDYYILCRKIEEAYRAWRSGKSLSSRPDSEYKAEILKEMETTNPQPWGLTKLNPLTIPKAYATEEN